MRQWANDLRLDVLFAVRLLLSNRVYTLTALLTIAIGIGAVSTAFSVINGVLLRPLPFTGADRLTSFFTVDQRGSQLPSTLAMVERLPTVTKSFEHVGAQQSLFAIAEAQPSVSVSIVSLDFMKIFNLHPILGRDFTADDIKPAATPVAIISSEFWQTRFGSDPNILGKTVILPGRFPELTIIGVLPQGSVSSRLQTIESVWMPFDLARGTGFMGSLPQGYGRLKAGVSVDQAQAELMAHRAQLVAEATPMVQPILDNFVGRYRSTIYVFSGGVLLVLLIMIVNLASLEIARLPRLERELAIRTALGASRWRLMQLMLVKTTLLGLIGGALGTAIVAALHSIIVSAIVNVPRKSDIVVDVRVLLFSFIASIVTSLLIGLVPAIRAARTNVRDMIQSAASGYTESRGSRLLQNTLTATQTGIAIVLTVAAGLLINNLWHLLNEDLGVTAAGVKTVGFSLPPAYDPARSQTLADNLLRRIQGVRGVEAAAIRMGEPWLSGSYESITGFDETDPNRPFSIQTQSATSDYFSVLHIPVLAGRTFTESESFGNAPVAMISATLADALWPGKNPVGRTFMRRQDVVTVIGVVRDVQYGFYSNIRVRAIKLLNAASLVTERNTVYYPIAWQLGRGSGIGRMIVVLARTNANARNLAAIVSDMEPKVEVSPGSLSDFVARATNEQRFQTTVLLSFAVIALLLASLGIYSVVAYSVVRRTREIGIRMALGARSSAVFIQVCGQTVVFSVLGVLVGLFVSFSVRQLIAGYLSQIPSDDGPTYIVVIVVTFLVVVAACSIPARRATRLNPVECLRSE